MPKELLISGEVIPYRLLVSERARNMRITIKSGGDILITLPKRARLGSLDTFLSGHKDWILEKWKVLSKHPKVPGAKESRALYEKYKEDARKIAHERVEFFNNHYRFTFGSIAIRNQKTRWGSCSKKGNLNFNYKIALLPPHLADYIVVHELCHLKEFNHGEQFWNLVAETMPEYKEYRKALKGKLD